MPHMRLIYPLAFCTTYVITNLLVLGAAYVRGVRIRAGASHLAQCAVHHAAAAGSARSRCAGRSSRGGVRLGGHLLLLVVLSLEVLHVRLAKPIKGSVKLF